MVVDQFPMFRLATLLARQLSSPVATRIKRYAVGNPKVGGRVCRCVAQSYHECEWMARTWALKMAGISLPKNARAPPLRDQTALNLGGDLLGEIIIFTIGSLIIIFEVNRQADIKETKELDEKSEWLAIMLSLEEIQREVQLQQQTIDRLHASLRALDSR
ncbi:hypothetical protein KGM_201909 [Danaus plexippus plexippus]|uniref:Uncharacterized protein n=1 Tax=Danaus plexippus plexippus TaxID=278856 RepID=A0A212F7F6_DANPL|nr:putative OPA3-like protein CG13603 [Danaus plexippus plexippus]OWR49675.1 hypothetical protein KGM_201909 [Danaus plexippus plexippus]